MNATYLKHTKKPSQFGGFFYYIFVKGDDGKSYRTCIGSNYRNFIKWQNVINTAQKGDTLVNLKTTFYKGKPIIDADSNVQLIKMRNETNILSTR